MQLVAKACAILHNMIIDDEADAVELDEHWVAEARPDHQHDYLATVQAVESVDEGEQLKRDLMEHVWEQVGNSKLVDSEL